MIQGSTGVLQPKEDYVSTTYKSNGYTRFALPSNKNTFTLVAYQCDYIRITKFRLRVKHICADGRPLSVRVDYYTQGSSVSHLS